MKNFNKKGFTLIEMLIVVVIIGILAAALIPRLTSVKDKANDSARKANLQQLVTAMSTYNLDNGILFSGNTLDTATSGALTQALAAGGMKSIPTDPSNKFQSINGQNITGYAYLSTTKGGVTSGSFLFISRAETEGAANFVQAVNLTNATDSDTLVLCDKVTESSTAAVANGCVGTKNQFRIIMKY